MPKKNTQVKMKNLTKGDLVNIFWRNTLGLQLGWNYPRMQGLGYAYTLCIYSNASFKEII